MNFEKSDYRLQIPDQALPEMMRVRQLFGGERIRDVRAAVLESLSALPEEDLRGKRVAVTAGSRGIANILDVTRAVVDFLVSKGAEPFIIPAMGSHGGGTAEGQTALLAHYGITEESMGVPVKSSMETARIGHTPSGAEVHCDRFALEADRIVVVNRVKAHSDFKAKYESGICKMMMVGLGKHLGAAAVHRAGSANFGTVIPEAARVHIDTGKILCGVALVENAREETMIAEAIPPERIIAREPELLEVAKKSQGRILLEEMDLLILDEMGKDISGAGMDPNVTGRPPTGAPGFVAPAIGKIAVLSLTACSEGNAIGVGMADIVSLDLARAFDPGPTYTNALTAGVTWAGRLPMVANDDRDVLAFAMMGLGKSSLRDMKIVHAKNTLELEDIEVSTNYAGEIRVRPDRFACAFERAPMAFDEDGRLKRLHAG